ncbi:MAG: MFS transporter [Dehalococcoidia bacterium]
MNDAADERAVKKTFVRLVPWCMLIYVLSYMDRINVGFAALTMNADLAISAQAFGFAGTAFYIFYSLCEVPSNVALTRFGARVWIARIMVTWGVASAATMFAVGPYSLCFLRALVGAAEAGLLPGMMYYLGQWFPHEHRARANALFLASLPTALLIGAPVSGVILQMDGWLGLRGWQWLFLLEGIPSVFVGFAVYFLLPNRPGEAAWLTNEEKIALQSRLDSDHATVRAAHPKVRDLITEISSPAILALGATYFCIINTITTFSIWAPLIVKDVLGEDHRVLLVSLVTAVPPFFAILAMQFVSTHSDRTHERRWHLLGSMSTAAVGWVLIARTDAVYAQMSGLCLCFMGAYAALAIFWASAAGAIPRHRQAVAIALISTIGTFASITSPAIIGYLRGVTHSFNAGAWYNTGVMIVGIGLFAVAAARNQTDKQQPSAP